MQTKRAYPFLCIRVHIIKGSPAAKTAGDPEFFSAEKVSNLTFDFLKYTFLHAVAVEVSNEAVALDFLDDFRDGEIAISHTLDAFGHLGNIKIVAEF